MSISPRETTMKTLDNKQDFPNCEDFPNDHEICKIQKIHTDPRDTLRVAKLSAAIVSDCTEDYRFASAER